MKTKITFVEKFNCAFVSFHNGVAAMHHDFHAKDHKPKSRLAALKKVKEIQVSLEEAFLLNPPKGYVLAGIAEPTELAVTSGFRKPVRHSKAEKKTDSNLGEANWFLYRLLTGYDATFVPVDSDWENKWAPPRGAGACITQPHQLKEIYSVRSGAIPLRFQVLPAWLTAYLYD